LISDSDRDNVATEWAKSQSARFQPKGYLQFIYDKATDLHCPASGRHRAGRALRDYGINFIPLFLLMVFFAPKTNNSNVPLIFGSVFFAIFVPVFYGVLGFVGGVIAAFFYNLVAKMTGGLEFKVTETPPPVY
jgi:hypothetical protein